MQYKYQKFLFPTSHSAAVSNLISNSVAVSQKKLPIESQSGVFLFHNAYAWIALLEVAARAASLNASVKVG